jgi:hypothetical protein
MCLQAESWAALPQHERWRQDGTPLLGLEQTSLEAPLLYALLHKDPARRPQCTAVLQDPFFAAAGLREHGAARNALARAEVLAAETEAAEAALEVAAAALAAEEDRLLLERVQSKATLEEERLALERERQALADAGQQTAEERRRVEELILAAEAARIQSESRFAVESTRLAEEGARLRDEGRALEALRAAAAEASAEAAEMARVAEEAARPKVPVHWANHGDNFQLVPDANAGARIHGWMKNTILHPGGCGNGGVLRSLKIVRVLRVQNGRLWRLFEARKNEMQLAAAAALNGAPSDLRGRVRQPLPPPDGGSVACSGNELWLLHGTGQTTAMRIAEHGFDSRLANDNGLYGAGTYFADCSCKAHQYTAKNSAANSELVMLACRVAMGWPLLARDGVRGRKPQDNPDTPGRAYDSVFAEAGVANRQSQNHNECIVYHGEQAYAEYVIYYTTN